MWLARRTGYVSAKRKIDVGSLTPQITLFDPVLLPLLLQLVLVLVIRQFVFILTRFVVGSSGRVLSGSGGCGPFLG